MPKSLDELLDTSTDDIKPPPLMPPGTYFVQIMGPGELIQSSQKQTPGFRFRYKFFQARDDVDKGDLATALEDGNMALTDVEMIDDFYLTERSMFMFKQYYQGTLKMQVSSPRQAAAEAGGHGLLIHIRHRARTDGSGFFAEIDTRKPAD